MIGEDGKAGTTSPPSAGDQFNRGFNPDRAQSRTIETVDKMVQSAKLDMSDFMPVSQSLFFADEMLDPGRFRLMEVPPELADELDAAAAEAGSDDDDNMDADASRRQVNLVFRGDKEDSAVICTADKTFDVKEAETSNSILIVDRLLDGREALERRLITGNIAAVYHEYLELKEMGRSGGQLRRIRSLLSVPSNTFSGALEDTQDLEAPRGLSEEELRSLVQCSDMELLEGLREAKALNLPTAETHVGSSPDRGRWFGVDPDYQMKVLSLIFNTVAEQGWSFKALPKVEIVQLLDHAEPPGVVPQIFDFFFKPLRPEEVAPLGKWSHKADTDEICRFYGNYLLQTGTEFELEGFLVLWQQALPHEEDSAFFRVDPAQLRGLALVDEDRQTIRSFPESRLPEGISERLKVLFDVRPRWTLEEMVPYIEPLVTPKLNANALLTKYARPINVNGVKHFCSKHGK